MLASGNIEAGGLVAVAQGRAGDVVIHLCDAGQQLQEQFALFARQRRDNPVLDRVDSSFDIFQKLASGVGEVKQLLSLVLSVRHAPNQVATFEALKHVANRRSIERNQCGQSGRISRFFGFNSRKGSVLNRRQIVVRTLIQKDCPRNLMSAANQVRGFGVEVFERQSWILVNLNERRP